MAITQVFNNSATVSTTELDLTTNATYSASTLNSTTGVYQLFLDLSNLATADRYQITTYEKVRSGSTVRIVDQVVYTGVQAEPIYVTPALTLMHGWTYTVKKLQGTDRVLEWSIRKVG